MSFVFHPPPDPLLVKSIVGKEMPFTRPQRQFAGSSLFAQRRKSL
jgi:hypothetical protein